MIQSILLDDLVLEMAKLKRDVPSRAIHHGPEVSEHVEAVLSRVISRCA